MKSILCTFVGALILISINACKSQDPSPEGVIGAWEFVSYKVHSDSTLREVWGTVKPLVTFKSNGVIESSMEEPFSGGWCNQAERYSLEGAKIQLEYGKANCIPLINVVPPSFAEILEQKDSSLTVQWGDRILYFKRK